MATAPPPLPAVGGQGVCTPEAILGFIDACLQVNSDEASCNAFTSANPACASCIGFPAGGMLQPVLVAGEVFVLPNVTSCEALVQGKPACAAEATNLNFCAYNSCSFCGDFEFEGCVQFSQGICSELFPVSDSCSSVFELQSFQCGGNDIFELITNIATVICG